LTPEGRGIDSTLNPIPKISPSAPGMLDDACPRSTQT
jgi:hypothetical protein